MPGPIHQPPPHVIDAVRAWWRSPGMAGPILGREHDIWRLFILNAIEAWKEAGQPPVTSWYRDPGTNRLAGGDSGSQHMLGLAFDFGGNSAKIARAFQRRGFTVTLGPNHTHVQMFPASVGAHQGVAEASRDLGFGP